MQKKKIIYYDIFRDLFFFSFGRLLFGLQAFLFWPTGLSLLAYRPFSFGLWPKERKKREKREKKESKEDAQKKHSK